MWKFLEKFIFIFFPFFRWYGYFPCMIGDDDSPFWQGWANLRIKTFRLIENKYFETAVIAMILLSSLALVSSVFKEIVLRMPEVFIQP